MINDDRIADLLIEWEEMLEQGQKVSAEQLCQDCPQLIEEMEKRIEALRATAWLLKDHEEGRDASTAIGMDQSGTVLAGRYRLDQLIGEGGFGRVWRGFDLELQRTIAIKVPSAGRLSSSDQAESFLAEARRVAQLKHPHIVSIHDVGRDAGLVFFVSDWIEGGSVADLIARQRPSPQEAARIVAEAAQAVHFAHQQGFIHRDIKPANLLLDNQGRVFLTDFGIAIRSEELPALLRTSGSLAYMAPEQCEGQRVVARTDVWSLGVVLYELLTGRLPFWHDRAVELRQAILSHALASLRSTDEAVSPDLERICLKCLSKRPEDRYPTAADLATALTEWMSRKGQQPRKNLIAGVIVALLLTVVFACLLALRMESPSSQTTALQEETSPKHGTETNDGNRPTIAPSGLDIETVFAEPHKYKSETVEFDGVTLYGVLRQGNVKGNYQLTLESKKGSLITHPAREHQGYGFYAPAPLGEQLKRTLDPEGKYKVRLLCKLEPWTSGGKPFWRGRVLAVHLYGADGKPEQDLKETAASHQGIVTDPSTFGKQTVELDRSSLSGGMAESATLAAEQSLFNGMNLDGWVFHSLRERNQVEDCVRLGDKALICSAKRQYYLRTQDRFRNFLLRLDYRSPADGRSMGMGSAVLLRMNKPNGRDLEYLRVKLGDWTTGIVVAAYAQLPNLPDCDTLFPDLRAMVKKNERPASEWNRLEVLCNGGAVSVKLNGSEVNREAAGDEQEGYIGLAPEGCDIEFRNVMLRAIKP